MGSGNHIVHGLWIGSCLTRLELLTLCSFVEHGHSFHLWIYRPLSHEVPPGVVLRNASEIIPYDQVFRKRKDDSETELGEGSYATFSDLFRAKLLFRHGGIWVDMDVLCLRPFNFAESYVFRAHRVGAVMNLVKCPQGCPVMGALIERMENRVCADSEWFGLTRMFYQIIQERGLKQYIREDLLPPDCWKSIQPFIESNAAFDPTWYGIHWINELWTTLRRNLGVYKGEQLAIRLPDKNHPIPGTTLHKLYERYGLLRPGWTPCPLPHIPANVPSSRQPLRMTSGTAPHINVLVPSMALGGAERSIQEIAVGLWRIGGTSNVFLFHEVSPSYSLEMPGCNVVDLSKIAEKDRLRLVASEVLQSPVRSIYVHLVRVRELAELERFGIAVIPVVQNSMPAWLDAPRAYERDGIPFVVTVSEATKREMTQLGCRKPIVAIRHELQRQTPSPEEAQAARAELRNRHGIPDDVLLIGMVGQFKAQKGYSRAIQVLRLVQEQVAARLMILGGWGQTWGAGRACYTAMARQALEAGVIADVVLPGVINPADQYYAAFDVFLSTSFYEGLSVSLLEAIAYGCPVVCTSAGGAAEVVTDQDAIINDIRDTEALAQAVIRAASIRERRLDRTDTGSSLVPCLWSAFARVAAWNRPTTSSAVAGRILFVTENLNIGGPQRSMLNLLRSWPGEDKPIVGVLDAVFGDSLLEEARTAGLKVFRLGSANAVPTAVAHDILALLDAFQINCIVFWNAPASLKLVLAKVLETQPIRLVDVSPGPMLLSELNEQRSFARRISFSIDAYLARLNCFVSKYANGLPGDFLNGLAGKYRVVRNGVREPAAVGSAPEIPTSLNPHYIIGTCTRIVPTKHLGFLVDMMEYLTIRLPEASLIILGGVDPRHLSYAQSIADKISRAGLSNICFLGPQGDVGPFLNAFQVFVMISDDQGCPNASLEAMAHGVPVVSNLSGGVSEQLENGINGYIVSEENPLEMAKAIEHLLRNPHFAKTMGESGRRIVQERFPMGKMVEGCMEACGLLP